MRDSSGLIGPILQIPPGLARHIGLAGAAVVQRLHTALEESSDHTKADGSRWARLTPSRWEILMLDALSWEALQPIVINLEACGVLVSADNCEDRDTGPCRWYSINYVELDRLAQGSAA